MADQYFREFQTLWFKASISTSIRLSVSGEDPSGESLSTASCPPVAIPADDKVHDRIDRTTTITQVKVVVQDPDAGPALTVTSNGGLTWVRDGSHQYAHITIPTTEGDHEEVDITIVKPGGTPYTRVQVVRIKHRTST